MENRSVTERKAALGDSERGGVMVEAAATFPLFFFFLFVFMEIVLSTYNWAIIQFSLDSISRNALVQAAIPPAEIEDMIIERVGRLGLGVALARADIIICGDITVPCASGVVESRGIAGGFFVAQIQHRIDFGFSPWAFTAQNTLFVRNEHR